MNRLFDANQARRVLQGFKEILNDPNELGVIVETTVLRHLVAYYYLDTPRFAYWRDAPTGKEVDVLVQSPSYTLPVEVKYRERTQYSDDSGLAAFCRAEKVARGYLVTKSEADFGVSTVAGTQTKLLRIPTHIFCYLLGQAERTLWQEPGAKKARRAKKP